MKITPLPDRTLIYIEDLQPASPREIMRFIASELPWRSIEQAAIAILSFAAVSLCAVTDPGLQRWGFVVGLASQPLWIHQTYIARQWGMFALSVLYVFAWIGGIVGRFF